MKPFDATTLWLTLSTFEPPCPIRAAQTLAVWLNREPVDGNLYLYRCRNDDQFKLACEIFNSEVRNAVDVRAVMKNGRFADTHYTTLVALYGVMQRIEEGSLL